MLATFLMFCLRALGSCAFRHRNFADARIFGGDEFAGAEGGGFKVGGVGGKDLPAGDFFSEDGDGAHVGKVFAETFVVVLSSGEPDAVVRGSVVALVAEDEDDFFADVDGEAAEHGIGSRFEGGERFEHKFMRDALARFCPEQRVLAKRSRVAIFLLDHSFLLLGDIISGFAPVGRAA